MAEKKQSRQAYLTQQAKLLPKEQQASALKSIAAAAKGGISKDELVNLDKGFNTTLYGADARSGTAGAAPWLTADTGGGTPTVEDPAAAELRRQAQADRKSAYAILEDAFKGYGLETLAPVIRSLMEQGVSTDEAALELRKTQAYKTRFIGNEGRIAKGLAVYSPAEYLQAEQTYRDVLAQNGLEALAGTETYSKLISGAVSPVEMQDRIVNVFNKIDNADSALKEQLGNYFSTYGVGDPALQRTQIASALLVGATSAQELERSLQKSQLRAAATTAGLGVLGEPEVTDLQKQLEAAKTYDVYGTAKKAFGELATVQPLTTKLSQIYNEDTTGLQQELQQEAFFGLASQRRKKLEQKEQAAFSGQSGISTVSLAQQASGSF
jgi:hypothetical protein